MAATREKSPVNGQRRSIALDLKVGCAHGAFARCLLDRLLEGGRLAVEGISATSTRKMNAAVLAYGLKQGGPERLHTALREFARAAKTSDPVPQAAVGKVPAQQLRPRTSPMSCPNQFNPVNLNPLRRAEQRHEQPKLERRH
ncbi:hypothetical protein [Paraburkholderia terrae]|uniref:hypothetical protein n=1 Tax=Paraburkholderia terrae TaxID=311230 RepID=UPI002067DACE|nr:hypothetical protein [Paraburkholderia terrae]BDC44759.1 hypothetical protein PTKU15_80560 [Paraburkholderia terrae]